MNEYLEEAKEELKRVDHIIYVSLKYTRTVDIIRNALHRLVSAFDYIIDGILWYDQEQKKITDIPRSPKEKIDLLRKVYPDDKQIEVYTTLYVFMRELVKAPYTRREEHRRHVTMVSQLKNQSAETTIDTLEDNFNKIAKEFLDYAEGLVGVRQDD